MPRRSGGGGGRAPASRGPARPTPVAPQRNNPAPPMPAARPASTTAGPGTQSGPPPGQAPGKSSGLFGQMASTAAGVAVGSTIGHALGGMFGGGAGNTATPEQADQALAGQDRGQMQNTQGYARCETAARDLTACLDEQSGNQHQMSICGWYLDQLKACQAAAAQY